MRGSSQVPPKSTDSARRAKISEKRAFSLATTRSQPSARFIPAPTASPRTLAMIGFATSCSASAAAFTGCIASSGCASRITPTEVGARAEVAAGAGDHEHPVGRVLRHLLEDASQFLPHRDGDGVLHLRAVQRERHHARVAAVHQQFGRGRRRHRSTLRGDIADPLGRRTPPSEERSPVI